MKCNHELPVSVTCVHCARQQGAADERKAVLDMVVALQLKCTADTAKVLALINAIRARGETQRASGEATT